MPPKELIAMFENVRGQDISLEEVRPEIREQGWTDEEIDSAYNAVFDVGKNESEGADTQGLLHMAQGMESEATETTPASSVPVGAGSILPNEKQPSFGIIAKVISVVAILGFVGGGYFAYAFYVKKVAQDDTVPQSEEQLPEATAKAVDVPEQVKPETNVATTTPELVPENETVIEEPTTVPVVKKTPIATADESPQDPVAIDKKVFRSEQFGFQFMYPAFFNTPNNSSGTNRLRIKLETTPIEIFFEKYGFEGIFVVAEKKLSEETFDAYITRSLLEFDLPFDIVNSKNILVDGMSGQQITGTMTYWEVSLNQLITFIEGSNFMYMIRNKPTESDQNGATSPRAVQIHNEIINSFEFFDPIE